MSDERSHEYWPGKSSPIIYVYVCGFCENGNHLHDTLSGRCVRVVGGQECQCRVVDVYVPEANRMMHKWSEHYLVAHPKNLQCQECGDFYDVLEGHKGCPGKPGWLADAEREFRFRINKPLSGRDVALQFQTEIQPRFDEHVTTFAHRQQRIGYWVWIVAGELCLSSFEITEHAWLQNRDAMFKRAEDARIRLMQFVKSAIQAARVRNEPGVAAVPDGGLIPLPPKE